MIKRYSPFYYTGDPEEQIAVAGGELFLGIAQAVRHRSISMPFRVTISLETEHINHRFVAILEGSEYLKDAR